MQSKKILLYLLSLTLVLGMSGAVFAAVVNVKTTVPNIVQSSCSQAGSVSLEFENGTKFQVGDSFQFTFSNGVTLCKGVEFFVRFVANSTESSVPGSGTLSSLHSPDATLKGETSTVGTDYGFLVQGSAGSQTLTFTFGYLNSTKEFDTSNTAGFVTYTDHTVGGTEAAPLVLTLFDETTASDAASPATVVGAIFEKNSDGKYEIFDTYVAPATDNALCINTSSYAGEYVEISADSGDMTFSGDSKVAHIIGSGSIAISWLCKTDCPDVPLSSGTTQTGLTTSTNGTIDVGSYTSGSGWTASGFCSSDYRNGLVITNSVGTFDDDEYIIYVTLKVNGVVDSTKAAWKTNTGDLYAYTSSVACDTTSLTAVTGSIDHGLYDSGTKLNVNATLSDATSKALVLDLPEITYDTSKLNDGDQLTIEVVFAQEPCGTMAEETLCAANFVSACTSSLCTMYIPYMTYAGNADYLSALAITNMSTSNGTLTFYLYDSNGGTGTVADMAISANEIKTLTIDDLVSQLDSGSTLDTTQNISIKVQSTVSADALCLLFGIGRAQTGQLYGYQARVHNCYSSGLD